MSLPKHLRDRYRYLAVAIEAWPDRELDRPGVQDAVWSACRGLHGDAGSAPIDPVIVRFESTEGAAGCVLRVRRGETDAARAAVTCVAAIEGAPVGIRVLGASGTIRGCEEKYLSERPESSTERTVVFENARRPAVVRDGLVDVGIDDAFTGATDLDLQGI